MWDQELTPGFWEYGCNTIAIQLEYHAIWRSAIIFFSRSASRFLERDCKSEGKCETLHLIPVHTIISTPLIQIKENGNLYELINCLQTKKTQGPTEQYFLLHSNINICRYLVRRQTWHFKFKYKLFPIGKSSNQFPLTCQFCNSFIVIELLKMWRNNWDFRMLYG